MTPNPVLVALWRFQAGRCGYCGRPMVDPRAAAKDRESPLRATIDHLTPLSAGGRDEPTNRVAACQACNVLKGPLDVATFLRLRWSHLHLNDAKVRLRLQHGARAHAGR